MYRSKTHSVSNSGNKSLPPADSYRLDDDTNSYNPLMNKRQSFSRERPKVSRNHRLLSTEKQRDTSRGHEDTYSPFNTSKKLEVEFLSTKDMNRGVWPPFRNKENEENIPVPTSSDSKWRSTEQDTGREYGNMLAELENIRYEHGVLQDKYNVTINRVHTIEDENRDVTIKFETLKGDYLVLQDQYNHCKVEIDKLRNQLKKQDGHYSMQVSNIENEFRNLLEERRNLQEENMQLKANFGRTVSETKDEKHRRDEERRDLYRKVREGQERLEAFRDEIDELKRDKRRYVDRNNELEKSNKELYSDNQRLADEVEYSEKRLLAKTEDEKTMKIVIEELRSKNGTLGKEEKSLRENLRNLNQEMDVLVKGHNDILESMKKRYETEHDELQKESNQQREELERLREEREMLVEEKTRIERKFDLMTNNMGEREKEHNSQVGGLFEQVNSLTEEKNKLDKDNRYMKIEIKTLEEDIRRNKDEIRILHNHNIELKNSLEESHRERDKMKERVREILEHNREYQKKDEELMKLRINEQGYLARIKALEDAVEEYKREKHDERMLSRKNYVTAASPFKHQQSVNERNMSGVEPKEVTREVAHRTYNKEENEGGMYGRTRNIPRSIERSRTPKEIVREKSGEKSMERLKEMLYNTETQASEQLASFGGNEREEGEYRVNGRLSFDKRERERENGVVESHYSTGNISGNTDLMRLTKMYNQIKSKSKMT